MLAEIVLIVQDIIQRIVIVGGVVLVSLTIVVLGILAGIVVLTDALVVTEVDAVCQTLQGQLHLTVEIGKERVGTVVVVDE